MFGITNYGLFIISGIILNITPGPDTIYVLGRSVSQGKKAGILSILGIETGTLIHTLLVAFGLAALLSKSSSTFNILKYVGAAYLIYLGLQILFVKSEVLSMKAQVNESNLKIYLQGFLTNLLNPKVVLFYLAFLPQFVSSNNNYGIWPFIILGLTFIGTGTTWLLIMATFAAYVTRKLRNSFKFSNMLNKATGVLFITLGVNLIRAKLTN